MSGALVLGFPFPPRTSLRWHLGEGEGWAGEWMGSVNPPGNLRVPRGSAVEQLPGLEVAEQGRPSLEPAAESSCCRTPVLLVMLGHAWSCSWQAPLHFGSYGHASPLGLCHILQPALGLVIWSPTVFVEASRRPSPGTPVTLCPAHPICNCSFLSHPIQAGFSGARGNRQVRAAEVNDKLQPLLCLTLL